MANVRNLHIFRSIAITNKLLCLGEGKFVVLIDREPTYSNIFLVS